MRLTKTAAPRASTATRTTIRPTARARCMSLRAGATRSLSRLTSRRQLRETAPISDRAWRSAATATPWRSPPTTSRAPRRGSTAIRAIDRSRKRAPCTCSPAPAPPGRSRRISSRRTRGRRPSAMASPKAISSATRSRSAPTATRWPWAPSAKTATRPESTATSRTTRRIRPAPLTCFRGAAPRGRSRPTSSRR